jgi:hypothetical protein
VDKATLQPYPLGPQDPEDLSNLSGSTAPHT